MDFPTGLDTFVNPTPTSPSNNPSLSSQQSDQNDAIEALESKVGVNNSAVTTSIDYLLKSTSSSNPGHKHTLANGATDVTASKDEVNILDGATITTAELNALGGINDAFTLYTPTISGSVSAIGNAVISTYFKQIGKMVFVKGQITFGTTTSFTAGNLTMSLPVTAGNFMGNILGTGYLENNGLAGYACFPQMGGTTSIYFVVLNTSSTYAAPNIVSNTVPFTWADTDFIRFNFWYEAA